MYQLYQLNNKLEVHIYNGAGISDGTNVLFYVGPYLEAKIVHNSVFVYVQMIRGH